MTATHGTSDPHIEKLTARLDRAMLARIGKVLDGETLADFLRTAIERELAVRRAEHTPYQELHRAWNRASAEDRERFLGEVASSGSSL